MTVHFIGAGPGAADLLTLRGKTIIEACPVCLYAGSLVPEEILSYCPADARIINTAMLDLDGIIEECKAATEAGHDIARLHSGDLSVWSAMGEQIRRLRAEGIEVSVTPGVPSFAAAAAAIGSTPKRLITPTTMIAADPISIPHRTGVILLSTPSPSSPKYMK